MTTPEHTLTSTVAKPTAVPASPPVLPQPLQSRDWVRLVQGFYFLFFGTLGALVTLIEVLLQPTTRPSFTLLSFASIAAVLIGAGRLYQTRRLTPEWHCRTRELLIVASLLFYLWFFFQMWLRLSTNFYFLLHTIAFAGLCLYSPTQLSIVIIALGRATGSKPLQTQAILYGSGSFLLLFLPYTLLANALVAAAQNGSDPLFAIQHLLHGIPIFILLTLLLPSSLVLSLAWAAKDIALAKLTGDKP